MSTEFLYQRSEALIAVGLLLVFALSGFVGRQIGLRMRKGDTEVNRAQVISITAAILALLSLLLGFTFSMALSRFEYRKQMVVQESNAIDTAARRSGFLPVSDHAEVDSLLLRYVDIRLGSVLGTDESSTARDRLDAEGRAIHRGLWALAAEAAGASPQSVPLGLFAQSVNDLIDMKAKRDVAVANHVPESALIFLFGLAVLAAGFLGYGDGLTGSRSPTATAAFSFIVALVILLIIDIDRPQRGLARVSQESMIQLQEILGDRRP